MNESTAYFVIEKVTAHFALRPANQWKDVLAQFLQANIKGRGITGSMVSYSPENGRDRLTIYFRDLTEFEITMDMPALSDNLQDAKSEVRVFVRSVALTLQQFTQRAVA